MKLLHARATLALLALTSPVSGQLTEWTTTVAPGHCLVEMDALSLARDHDGGDRFQEIRVASTFVSTGLNRRWDLQLGFDLYVSRRSESDGVTSRSTGLGDAYFRTKWRFYENESSGTAMAALPYVKIPTNTGGVGNRELEGGLIVPWVFKLAGEMEVAGMTEFDLTRNGRDDGYHGAWYGTMTVSRAVSKAAGLYAEVAAAKSTGHDPWETTVGLGSTLSVSEKAWWDIAIYRGLSRSAVDWNPVVRFNVEF